jgi:hypothetical protein
LRRRRKKLKKKKKKKTVVEGKKTKSKRRNMSYADDEGANRPKLSLQPRGSAADMSSASPVKTSRVSLCSFFLESVPCGVCQNVRGYEYVTRTRYFLVVSLVAGVCVLRVPLEIKSTVECYDF